MHLCLKTGPLCPILYTKIKGALFFSNVQDGLSHTTDISARIFPATVLHLHFTGDYLGCRPTCITRHMTFHPTICAAEDIIFLRSVRDRW